MMSRTTLDLWVGIFVALGFAALVFLATQVGNLTGLNSAQTYVVEAQFDNIGGLKVRAPVRSAGVERAPRAGGDLDPQLAARMRRGDQIPQRRRGQPGLRSGEHANVDQVGDKPDAHDVVTGAEGVLDRQGRRRLRQ